VRAAHLTPGEKRIIKQEINVIKRVEFSQHPLLKIEILESRGVRISTDLISETIRTPSKLEASGEIKFICQQRLNGLVLRVVYQEYDDKILVITAYPGKRSRYEKD